MYRAALSLTLILLSSTALAQSQPASPVQLGQSRLSYDVPTIDIAGTVYSVNNAELTAGIEGRLSWVAEPGTLVKTGDLLARVDPVPLQLQRAELDAQLQRATLQADYLQRELKRLEELQQSQSISLLQLDKARSDALLAQADARIIESRLAQLDDQLNRTEIRAPFAGVVASRLREAGIDVTRNTPLLRLQDIYQLEVRAFVPLQYLRNINTGDPLLISNSYTQDTAAVTAIIPAADGQSQTAELRLKLPRVQQQWLSGELVNVKVATRMATAAVTVPRDAILLRSDGSWVVTVDSDNVAHRKAVKVSNGNADWVTIDEGLQAGEKVVVRGAERLQEGQKVTPDEAKITAEQLVSKR